MFVITTQVFFVIVNIARNQAGDALFVWFKAYSVGNIVKV
jgi:hypothetical protein